jgi:Tol biopolymer transport system component
MRTGVVAIGALLLLIGPVGSAPGSFPGRNGVLAFAAAAPVKQLFSVAIDGSDEQQVTHDFGSPFFGVWSHDGKHFAFLAYELSPKGGTALVVANSDGSGERVLDDSALTGADPAWSPSDDEIAFSHGVARSTGLVSEVWVVLRDGSGKRALGTGGAPAWSTDGGSIVAADGHDLVVYDVASGTRRELATAGLDTWLPTFSPDSKEIVYTEVDRNDAVNASIRMVEANGADDHFLTSGFSATWSPNGERLAVVKKFYGAGPIDVIDRTGKLIAHFEEANLLRPGLVARWEVDRLYGRHRSEPPHCRRG